MSSSEQQIIYQQCREQRFETWPLSGIYYQLLREQNINCCLSTFYKYCRLMNITRRRVHKPVHYEPLKAEAPLKMLHMDVTIFKTINGVRHYIYVIRDNCSRTILAAKAALTKSSNIALQTLREVLMKYQLMEQEGCLITDDGSENKGDVAQWMNKPGTLWKQLIAQVDIIQSNSMVEAANKILKYRYLFPKPIPDTQALEQTLNAAVNQYNSIPQKALHGYTPDEVLQGAVPDKHRFKKQIATGKLLWMQQNKNFVCATGCKT